jgi:hypothetical protein
MRGHLPKRELLHQRHLTAEHQLAKARLRRRQMAERLEAAQQAFDAALRRELIAEQSATVAAAKLAAAAAPSGSGGKAPTSPTRGRLTKAERARRDATFAMMIEGRQVEVYRPAAPSAAALCPPGPSAPVCNRSEAGVHVAGETEFRAAGAANSSSLAGATEGAGQTAILLPAVDQLAGSEIPPASHAAGASRPLSSSSVPSPRRGFGPTAAPHSRAPQPVDADSVEARARRSGHAAAAHDFDSVDLAGA